MRHNIDLVTTNGRSDVLSLRPDEPVVLRWLDAEAERCRPVVFFHASWLAVELPPGCSGSCGHGFEFVTAIPVGGRCEVSRFGSVRARDSDANGPTTGPPAVTGALTVTTLSDDLRALGEGLQIACLCKATAWFSPVGPGKQPDQPSDRENTEDGDRDQRDEATLAESLTEVLTTGGLFSREVLVLNHPQIVADDYEEVGSCRTRDSPLGRRLRAGRDEAPAGAGASLVVGTGVDPVTYRFSGGRSAN